MNDMSLPPRTTSELRVVPGGAGLAALGVGKTYKKRPVVRNVTIRLRRGENGALPADASLFEIVADFERRTIIEALERFSWSQTDAAEALRVPLSTLNQKIKRLNIDVKRRGDRAN